MNWIILTKMLRGMSRGTTLLDPLGNRVEMMEVKRLRRKLEKIIFSQLIITGINIYHHRQHLKLHAITVYQEKIQLPLCGCVTLTLDPDHVDPQ